MPLRHLALLLLTGVLPLYAQQAPTPSAEPQYINEFAAIKADGSLLPLEQQKMTHQSKSQNRFIYVKGTGEGVVPNEHSPMRLPGDSSFIVKLSGMGNVDPATQVFLKPLNVEKGQRGLPEHTAKVGMFQGMKSSAAPDTSIPVTFKRYGDSSLIITPVSKLQPGEYVLETNGGLMGVSCFGVDAGLQSAIGPGGSAANTAPTEPPGWRIKPATKPDATTDMQEATLHGTSEAATQRGAAMLAVSCTIHHFTTGAQPQLSAKLRVRRGMIDFPSNDLSCAGDGNEGNTFLHSELGTSDPQQGSLCYEGEFPAGKMDAVDIDLAYDHPADWFKSLTTSAGTLLKLRIRTDKAEQDNLVTAFQLPANTATLGPVMDPCFKLIDEQSRKLAEAIVVACPKMPGLKLSDAHVLVGPAMKELATDPENDIGAAWNLPKITKARPVRPKLTLACLYKPEAGAPLSSPAPAKKMVPIPATATSCVSREDNRTDGLYGQCTR